MLQQPIIFRATIKHGESDNDTSGEWEFNAPADLTLLEAARQARIVLPSSCRNGTCRTCRCLMQQGTVHYLIEWPGLSATEKEDGYVLPCVAYPSADVRLIDPRATQTVSHGNSKITTK